MVVVVKMFSEKQVHKFLFC